MKTIEIFGTILGKMQGISYPFEKFLKEILLVFLILQGKCSFINMARWSKLGEKTFRRNYQKNLPLDQLTVLLVENYAQDKEFIACSDASFIPKSGKKTYGLGKFWCGTRQKTEKGLQISALALISLEKDLNLCLSVEQTPSELNKESRIDFYLAQIEQNLAYLKTKVKYWVGDGFYAKEKMWEKMSTWGLCAISKLRTDANFFEIYQGEQKKRGRKRVKGDKILWKNLNLDTWVYEGKSQKGHAVWSRVLWSVQWKRKLKIAYVQIGKGKYALLASNDLEISGLTMCNLYSKRFQIEFMFRDTKQHLGLKECQSRKKECLSFHFKFSFLVYNFCRAEHFLRGSRVFSLQKLKQACFQTSFVEKILQNLGLDAELFKNTQVCKDDLNKPIFHSQKCP